MPSKDLGEVTFVLCGEWRSDVTYQRLSIVSIDGSGYCAKRKNKGERPYAGSAYWQMIAARGVQGQDGKQGADGAPGKGVQILGTVGTVDDLPETAEQGDMYNVGTSAPYTVYMFDGGAWVSQGQLLRGEKGEKGDTGAQGPAGSDGITPTIGENGDWYLGATDTGKPSRGAQGEKGEKGDTGAQGPAGSDGITPTIGENGDWYLGATDTGKPSRGAQGEKGEKGDTGASPVRGVDYWTAADKQEIVDSARTALYSPVEYFDGTHALTAADIGKTLASSGAAENTVTLTTAVSAAMPIGAEIAVFWMAGTNVKLQFTGTMRIVMPGEDVLINGSLQLGKMFTLVALKKMTTDAANGDIWTVQGDVEVVE